MVDDEVCFKEQMDEARYYDMSERYQNKGERRRYTQTHPGKSNLVGPTGCWSNMAYSKKSNSHDSCP